MRVALAGLAAAVALAGCASGETDVDAQSPTPEVSASALDRPSPSPSASESASPGESASPSEEPSEGASEPTDTDRARFVSNYRPDGASDLEHVQVDIDGDGVDELVFAYVRGDDRVGHVDLADWNAETAEYEVLAGADGGVADRVDRIRIADLNADDRVEVALFQATGSSGASLSMWAVDDGRLLPLRARGGCWDGQATYGVIGAELRDGDGDGLLELYATCDDSPLPVAAWSTDGYRWRDGAWTHDPSL